MNYFQLWWSHVSAASILQRYECIVEWLNEYFGQKRKTSSNGIKERHKSSHLWSKRERGYTPTLKKSHSTVLRSLWMIRFTVIDKYVIIFCDIGKQLRIFSPWLHWLKTSLFFFVTTGQVSHMTSIKLSKTNWRPDWRQKNQTRTEDRFSAVGQSINREHTSWVTIPASLH